jgi:hypothetical protein
VAIFASPAVARGRGLTLGPFPQRNGTERLRAHLRVTLSLSLSVAAAVEKLPTNSITSSPLFPTGSLKPYEVSEKI